MPALREDPLTAADHCRHAAELRLAGRHHDAAGAARRALALDQTLVAARIHLAHSLLATHDHHGAMAACHEAMEREPRNALAHHAAGCALLALREPAPAERHLRIAISLDPGSADLLVELGDLLRRGGRRDDAAAAYARALTINPRCLDAIIGTLRLAAAQRRTDEALALGRRLLKLAPRDGAAVCAAAEALGAAGRAPEAASLLEETLRRGGLPAHVERSMLFLLGQELDRVGRFDEAWSAVSRARSAPGTDQRFDRSATESLFAEIRETFSSRRQFHATPPRGPGDPRPVFIAGMPRSGTSLLEQILDSHPQVRGAGELDLLGRVVRRLPSLGGPAAAWPACIGTIGAAPLAAAAAFVRGELRAAAAGREVVIEKTPDNALYLGMIALLCPDARVLWCRRDALDTCVSCYFQDFSSALPYARDLGDLGFYCSRITGLMEHWTRTLPLPILAVEYERLVAAPEPTVRAMLQFLELPWSQRCLAFHENPREVQTASREQVRRPLYASSVGRHRNYRRHLGGLS